MFGNLKKILDRIRIDRKRTYWKKTGRIKLDSSAIVFAETTMSAALGYISVDKIVIALKYNEKTERLTVVQNAI